MVLNKKKIRVIESYSFSQHDIIKDIIDLHLDGERIHLDPCYGNGNFYKPDDIEEPIIATDSSVDVANKIEHRIVDLCIAQHMPLIKNDSIRSIIFDPPFLQTTGKGSIIKDRFGSYSSMEKLWQFYAKALWEFCRVLKPDGVLIVKIQNTIMSGKQWRSEHYISNLANEYGLKFVDEFILLAKRRMPQHNLKKQRHARKHHSFFLVFRK